MGDIKTVNDIWPAAVGASRHREIVETDQNADVGMEGGGLLTYVDLLRMEATSKLLAGTRAELGQFLTSSGVAELMASMPGFPGDEVRILDPGAGVGTLFAACVAELCRRPKRPKRIHVTAYEIDQGFALYLQQTVAACRRLCHGSGIEFDAEVWHADFLRCAGELLGADMFAQRPAPAFTCAIINPPYRKIRSDSQDRRLLQKLGVETSNAYTGFLAAAIKLLAPSGELVAITPRSFCNGPYFKRFRQFLLDSLSIHRFHLYDSRKKPFSDDAVLQENLIMHAAKGERKRSTCVLSWSEGPDDDLHSFREVDFRRVVYPNDPQCFIRIVPDEAGDWVARSIGAFHATLADVGLQVSTGRVVEFRARDFLRQTSESGTVPLIYPSHLERGRVRWPNHKSRKPNALVLVDRTQSLVLPNETYVLVKRLSSKEEDKRIVAAVYDPQGAANSVVGFENHLNYYHNNGRGLETSLARGLAAFLNSTLVDAFFRQFNGHTQVNACDLRSLKYPTRCQLESLGSALRNDWPEQNELDRIIREECLGLNENDQSPVDERRRRIDEAVAVLTALGLPKPQQNDRSALTLLALLNLPPGVPWSEAATPSLGITPMMEFFAQHYGKAYKPNTRETVRRETVHQFVDAGLVVANPDNPSLATNSPKAAYCIEESALIVCRAFGSSEWEARLTNYLASNRQHLSGISWETEVWVAEAPSHLIHFNGERFLGPYESLGESGQGST